MLRLPIEKTLICQMRGSLWQHTWGYCSRFPRLAGMALFVLVVLLSGCTAPRQTSETVPIGLHPRPDLMRQTQAEADRKSAGGLSCHTTLDAPTMHLSPAVHLGCTDCHGGNASAHSPSGGPAGSTYYQQAKHQAHVQARFPHAWPTSANPVRSYTLLNRE